MMAFGTARREQLLARYAGSGYKQVKGFVFGGAIPLTLAVGNAQRVLDVRGGIAEIGVFYGRYFILLYLMRREGERAVAVDVFEGEYRPFLDEFLQNVRAHTDGAEDVAILRTDSRALGPEELRHAAGAPLRLASVDGHHAAAAVEHDLQIAAAALHEGGVILLDDYFNECEPGVSEGAARFMLRGGHDLVPFVIGANKLFLCRAGYAERYRDALKHADIKVPGYEGELFGCPVTTYNFAPVRILGVNVSRSLVNTRLWRQIRDTPLGQAIRFRLRRSC